MKLKCVFDIMKNRGGNMDAQSQQIQLLITMRLRRLHREGYDGLRYLDLERVFTKYVWRKGMPNHLSVIGDTILNMSTDQIIRYLSIDAACNGGRDKLSDLVHEV